MLNICTDLLLFVIITLKNTENIFFNMTFSAYYAHTAPIFRDHEILTIDRIIVHRIGTVMYKFNYGLLLNVLNAMYKKNCVVHSYKIRSKDMFRISSCTQTLSYIWH